MQLAELGTKPVIVVEPDASVEKAIDLMERHGIRHLPVVKKRRLVGMLSDRDLLLAVGWKHESDRRLARGSKALAGPAAVGEIMSTPVVRLSATATVREAATILVERKIDALPLVAAGALVGIVTTGDLLRYFRQPVKWWVSHEVFDEAVANYMHGGPVVVGPKDTLEMAAALMHERRIRHLPVVAGGELVGVISDRDIRRSCGKALVEDAQAEANGELYFEKATAMDVMSRRVLTIEPRATLREAGSVLLEHRIGALPVVSGERLVGIITGVDLLRAIGAADENAE